MPADPGRVLVAGSFDDPRSADVRFLHEASRLGPVEVLLLSDAAVERRTGDPPSFPETERRYLVEALRFVERVTLVEDPAELAAGPGLWVVREDADAPELRSLCESVDLRCVVIRDPALSGYPDPIGQVLADGAPSRKKAIVTGCYDWLHSGHVRFLEEVSGLGDLFVTVGSDRNVRFLKGAGHPLYSEEERRYMVASIRFVRQAMVATGSGWLDAEPEIERLRPDIYAVNEDGDRPEKREFCERRGIEYRVLKRLPREGLPVRRSTEFRGF